MFPELHRGFVKDNADPKMLGRVRVIVPGLIEPDASAWAWPLGTSGGGVKATGFFAVPPVNAEVGVLFHLGDIDHPYYLAGHWGDGEAPTDWAGLAAADVPKVRTVEFGNYRITFDEKNDRFTITEKAGGAFLRLTNAKLELGGAATEPAVLGNVLKAKLSALCDAFIAHTHPTAMGPSGPPVNASDVSTIKAALDAILAAVAKVV